MEDQSKGTLFWIFFLSFFFPFNKKINFIYFKVTGSQIQKQLLLSDLQQQMSNNEKNALQSAIKDSMVFSLFF